MGKCPDTAPEVKEQLCGLHYLPHHTRHCASVVACNKHLERWLKEVPEVQKLHYAHQEKVLDSLIDSNMREMIQAHDRALDENEKRIFGEKVADGTLKKVDMDAIPLSSKEVVFCSDKTRHKILSSVYAPYLKIYISVAIQDDNVYLLTDEKLKSRIFEREYESKKRAERVALLARLEEHNTNMYGVELSNADRLLCIEALKMQLGE